MANGLLTILRVNYRVIDDLNATLETRILSRQLWDSRSHNIPNPMFKTTLFRMIDLNKMSLALAKWIILRHYSFHSCGAGPDSLYTRLRSVPLDPQTGVIDLISRKFPTDPQNQIVVNDIRMGIHQQIGTTSTTSTATKESLGHTYKKLNYQESPWIECTTTLSINSIRLEIQDQYGQPFTTSSPTADKQFRAILSFIYVPL